MSASMLDSNVLIRLYSKDTTLQYVQKRPSMLSVDIKIYLNGRSP